MADKKISELTELTTPDGAEELVVNDGGTSKKITIDNIFNQSIDVTGTVTADGLTVDGNATADAFDLSAIATDITDTAVDVFVYDTSKDSDGGAWRKRTQHTSWYNETLNTSTRGSRKEFPAVAVIVAESDKVTIYDGDDPALPMWMVFPFIVISPTSITSVKMLQGKLVIGSDSSSSIGLTVYDFPSDSGQAWYTWGNKPLVGGIFNRPADLTTWNVVFAGSYSGSNLVNAVVNDVAMTVLPDAPIDPATGLPVPTIAAATDGGVSVIKDDGTVVDVGSASYTFLSVEFRDNLLFTSNGSSGGHTRIFEVDKLNADWASPLKIYDYWGVPYITQKSTWSSGKVALPTREQEFAQITSSNKLTLVGSYLQSTGVPAAENEDLASYISSTYNTGWMNGDIKLATLSDTDATNVTGSELVTNGTFDTDISGWTASDAGCSLSLVSNQLRITNNDATAGGAVTPISVVSGKVYTFSVGTSSGTEQLYLGASPNNATYFGPVISNSTTWTSTVTGTVYFMVKNLSTTNGATIDLDNISVRLAEEDRSVNGNGLQVFGTVTRTFVDEV